MTRRPELPTGIHVLTAIHGLGSGACVVLAVGSALFAEFRHGLARTGGSELMVEIFGPWTWLFLGAIAVVLAALCYGSWTRRPYAWPLTLVVYSIGVLGSLWQVTMGIPQGWLSAVVNAGVVAYASRSDVRRAFGWGV